MYWLNMNFKNIVWIIIIIMCVCVCGDRFSVVLFNVTTSYATSKLIYLT